MQFIMKSMKNLNTELTYREHWAKVDIRRDIQSDSLSPLLFVICMILLTQTLRKVASGYTLKNGEKFNQYLF